MGRTALALALLAAGCGRSEGVVLERACEPACGPGGDAGAGGFAAAGGSGGSAGQSGGAGAAGTAGGAGKPATTTLSASNAATCATLPDRTLWCWGANADGALGAPGDPLPPTRVALSHDWVEVSGAHGHCALRPDRALFCWGPDHAVPSVDSTIEPTQVEPSIAWARSIAGGQHHCALAQDGGLYCWGANDRGQLGLGDDVARTAPTRLAGTWAVASVGLGHTCAIGVDGSLWCWGQAGQGQLGFPSTQNRTSPVRVGTGTDWDQVSAGGNHTCALDRQGALSCWGENVYGEVGTGDTAIHTAPAAVTGTYRAVASGGGLTCAIATDGTLWCWGDFGQKPQPGASHVPKRVDDNPDWIAITAGYSHACGARTGAGIHCLGWNFSGQLAKPASVSWSAIPVPVTM